MRRFIKLFPFLTMLAMVSCAPVNDRLEPSGKTVDIPQGNQFCSEHPGDALCSQ